MQVAAAARADAMSGQPLWLTLSGAALGIVSYALSTVSQTFWLNAPLSLFGQFTFFLLSMALLSFAMLGAAAAAARDARILLPHHRRAGRRLFCCTLCAGLPDAPRPRDVAGGEDGGGGGGPSAAARGSGGAAAAVGGGCAARLTWLRLSQTEVLLLLGLNNGAAALVQFWATPPTREPPLISSLLSSLTVVAAIPLSKFALGDGKRYAAAEPVLAVVLIVASVALSLLPAALSGAALAGAESARDVILWTALNAASMVPSAMANIGAQAYLLRSGGRLPGSDGRRASLVGVLRFVAYNQISVALLTAFCWWADLLPWFGSTAGGRVDDFAAGLAYSFRCSLLGPAAAGAPPAGLPAGACGADTPLWAALSVLPYAGYLVGTAIVSQDSGVFSTVVQVVTSALISVVWLIPGLNPDAAATPLWAIGPALALGLAGTAVYKRWELRHDGGAHAMHAAGLEPVPDDLHSAGKLAPGGAGGEARAPGGGEALTDALLPSARAPAVQ